MTVRSGSTYRAFRRNVIFCRLPGWEQPKAEGQALKHERVRSLFAALKHEFPKPWTRTPRREASTRQAQ